MVTSRSLRSMVSILPLVAVGFLTPASQAVPRASDVDYRAVIVEASSTSEAWHSVVRVGARPGRRLEIIHAVSAQLGSRQRALLNAEPGIRIFDDRAVRVAASKIPSQSAIGIVAADSLATSFVDGQ